VGFEGMAFNSLDIFFRKSPLAPLACLYGREKIAKEGNPFLCKV
jgi:hypothetical protein